ncbi:gamma-tubulin complex component 6-like [Asterias amurensis]|uniref:gamma-tubulin complex component 6-like n=1 Tax=Asterias amurensis TaxID=7602 RepID=UPI003AB87815
MDSISGLFNQLVDKHVKKELLQSRLNPSNTTLAKHRQALRTSLYTTLFSHLNGPLQQDDVIRDSPESVWNVVEDCDAVTGTKEKLLQVVFEMRQQRKYDKAHKLERLLSTIPDVDNGNHSELKAAIQLLLTLAGTCPKNNKDLPVGYQEPDLPLVDVKNKGDRSVVLPRGPRYHGDSCHVYHQGYQGYIHYPRELFEGKQLPLVKTNGEDAEDGYHRILEKKLFEVEPGKDLLGNGLFSLKGLLDGEHEKHTRETLFTGLTHSKTRQLNIKLSFPELPDTTNQDLLGLNIPNLSEPSDDEGFHEASSSVSTPATEASIKPEEDEENIWHLALQYQPNQHYTWETLGCRPHVTERPYLTEAGSKVFDEMYRLRCQEASVLDASLQRPLVILPNQDQLVRDSLNVLLSVPSETFMLNKEAQCFVINPDICLTGTTPGSLHRLLGELAQAGTDHHRLTIFAQQRVLDSTYTGGLVLQAFTSSIRRFMHYYQAVVQRAPSCDGKLTVLMIRAMYGKMMKQLRYLASLCRCNQRLITKPGDPGDSFPLGIRLLSYLYEEALDCSLQDRYQLVLSLLRSSCGPYLMFIQDWVFHGICRDLFGEFLIKVSDEYLHYRDKHYWTQGFVLASRNTEDSVPLFLKDLAYDIYVCGKSLNLIRLCCPEHFLCNPGVSIPRINLTFSAEELEDSAERTRVYVGHMRALARQKTVSRREKELLELETRQELMTKARKAAADELKKIIDAMQEQRVAEDSKKREAFKEFKDQMQRDLVRRALAEETEKQEDIERIEAVTKRETGEAKAQYDLEQKVREELVEYYAGLTEEASAREQRALWRVRRHQLDQARVEFIQQEETRLQQELVLKQQGSVPLSGSEDTLKTSEVVQGSESVAGQSVVSGGTEDQDDNRPDGSQISSAVPEEDSQQGSQVSERSSKMKLATGRQHLPTVKQIGEPELELLISVGSDFLGTGELPNQDIEATLQMIAGGGTGADLQAKADAKNPTTHRYLISDFLPKEHVEDDGLEQASSIGADVDDVLIQIGSSLPTEAENSQAALPQDSNIIDEMLGVPTVSPSIGHPSNSIVGGILYSPNTPVEQSIPESSTALGHPSDSNLGGSGEVTGGDLRKVVKSTYGHAGDSSLGDFLYPKGTDSQVLLNPSGQIDSSSSQKPLLPVALLPSAPVTSVESPVLYLQMLVADHRTGMFCTPKVPLLPSTPVAPVEPPLLSPSDADSRPSDLNLRGGHIAKSAFGHAGDSSLGDVLYPKENLGEDSNSKENVSSTEASYLVKDRAILGIPTTGAHPSDSHLGDMLYPAAVQQQTHHTPGASKESNTSQSVSQSHYIKHNIISGVSQVGSIEGAVIFRPPIAHSSDSSIQSMLYPDDKNIVYKQLGDGGETKMTVVAHGHHPSDSTAQRFMYGGIGQQKGGQTKTDGGESTEDRSVVVWLAEGVEPLQDNFDILDKPPMPDLLSNTGFMPLSTEVGDYGLQALESDSMEAVELQSLPIIMKRSVTAPLLAQISLVNKGILDYFIVELGIGKHFETLRSFLFLEDGEFGLSLCDQLFDKLAQGMRPPELLTPMVLNQLLARAVQYSTNSESKYANNLGFSLKYLPHHFKPNAIDTFDCLELRYKVEWPCNIVITDTCLAKYNKVFSFLVQLKRTSWVLRDIYFHLKRHGMVNHAGNSPQFRQLQLFRHEMQHFVNVMQGYVVNQIIHVTWEEFQRQLKTEVHNLDDLHQKHADYLNKAVFRCLLNKKAAPVMKIITDILCLILKVRTQLVSASWVFDKEKKQASHPGFHNIRMSFLAFKEYSGFLYKVVAKLVTRGYQPHLEEFMLRLNFNDFYQET